MSKKTSTVIKGVLLLFGIGGIIGGLFSRDLSMGNRLFYVCAGATVCVIALVSVVRWVAISLLAFSVGIAGIPLIFAESGQFDLAGLLTVISCIAIGSYFGYKAYRQFKTNHVRRVSQPTLESIDLMSGLEFEEYTAQLLKKLGYTNITVTKASGDQGIDVLAQKNGVKYAIQCKNYHNKLDNTPVQEAYAGMAFYNCDVGVVITNSTFTEGAQELAKSIGVLLWDRQVLQEMMYKANKKPSFEILSAAITPKSNNHSQISVTHTQDAAYQHTAEPCHVHVQHTSTDILIEKFSNGYIDDLFPAAVDVILETGQASVSMLQRRLKLGYARAARIVDEMEEKGIVGPFQGSKPRDILITTDQWALVLPRLATNNSRYSEEDSDVPEQAPADEQFIAEAQWYATRSDSDS